MRRSFLHLLLVVLRLGSATAADSGAVIERKDGSAEVSWPISEKERGKIVFSLKEDQPLIKSISVGEKPIVKGLNPVTLLTVGSRDMKSPAGWVAFFDNPRLRHYDTYAVKLGRRSLNDLKDGNRVLLQVAEVSAGPFKGHVQFTLYRNSPLILMETVLSTEEDGRAIVYDTGLASAKPDWKATVWRDTQGQVQRAPLDVGAEASNLAVAGRAIVAEGEGGALAVFPAPHRFFFPLDEAFNLKFVWYGRNYGKLLPDYGIGIRQSNDGDKRFVPWFNAPPNTKQQLGMFCLITDGGGEKALDEVAKYTHADRYPKLPGHSTFTSHYHIEHTKEYLRKQKEQNTTGVPAGLEVPGFVKTFKARGVNIVHLAEFHNGQTPKMKRDERLLELGTMHRECERLSDPELLILPGEEANVHLGGHWLSFFPKPVYWVLNREGGKPFAEQVEGFGTVYHVGDPGDVLELMEKENGLMWTAHARIKSSIGYPDKYKDSEFFRSKHFLGAAWKAMPADLSRPTLGWRVLDLLDDMSNWGARKQAHGEADLFRMETDFETYAHMNINYLRLDKLPNFKDGWQPVLDALRSGAFFTTTGEVLISDFTIDGKASGETVKLKADADPVLEGHLEWTFPLAFAVIVSGDGQKVTRHIVNMNDTEQFGSHGMKMPVDYLKERTWVRLEVWDVAGNGAYTQPVWLEK
ncbi:hypothetical protein [Brevifollis gellanilyticus]|uniref:Uncharacterized protein n=1 Tax=Brevifollis gellanilyticus TaxID=748831 RepID=A0A512M4N0_9BACT|nr:hypothetical protein [Brevifollis gellanilyticus]GEP41693.1 hypothetical protein BGE01nite_09840 [Brevifollis gellanilyticus]